jgi:hypothetical protein
MEPNRYWKEQRQSRAASCVALIILPVALRLAAVGPSALCAAGATGPAELATKPLPFLG